MDLNTFFNSLFRTLHPAMKPQGSLNSGHTQPWRCREASVTRSRPAARASLTVVLGVSSRSLSVVLGLAQVSHFDHRLSNYTWEREWISRGYPAPKQVLVFGFPGR